MRVYEGSRAHQEGKDTANDARQDLRKALQAPRGPNSGELAHEQPQVARTDVDQQPLEDVVAAS